MLTTPFSYSAYPDWLLATHHRHRHHPHNQQPKRRTPKVQKTVEVTRRNQPNNGNIEVIPSADPNPWSGVNMFNALTGTNVEEIYINDRKFLIPERTLRLDFLDKVHQIRGISVGGSASEETRRPSAVTIAASAKDEEDEESSRFVLLACFQCLLIWLTD